MKFSTLFGKCTSDTSINSLKQKRAEKYGKYINLIKYIQINFEEINAKCTKKGIKCEVEFRNIIVSSLGVIPKYTFRYIATVIDAKNQTIVNLLRKRMTMNILKGSFFL
jgi:hypothetical protein